MQFARKINLFFLISILFFGLPLSAHSQNVTQQEARQIVEKCWDYMRGKTSHIKAQMTIHRPEWERAMTIEATTKGRKQSIFFITAPAKDKGNGTLKKGNEMWIYNPKVKRVIKLPPSMMAQSWMGSDFSNNDLSKSDSIIDDYTHKIVSSTTEQGHKVYVVEAVPKPHAPVVWGKQVLKVREDGIMLEEGFYDEQGVLVKELIVEEIEKFGGKLYPRKWIMRKAGETQRYTQIYYEALEFDVPVEESLFTISNLQSTRRL